MEVLRHKYRQLDIEVDGGVGPSTIDAAAKVSKFATPLNVIPYLIYWSITTVLHGEFARKPLRKSNFG